MTLAIPQAHREVRLLATRALLDGGASGAKLLVYGTDRPELGAAAGSDPLMVMQLAKPSGDIADGKLWLLAADADGSMITMTGTAVWARLVNGAGALVADGDCSDDTGAGDFRLSITALKLGGYVLLRPSFLR